MAEDDNLPFELGDNPCEDCGEQDWQKFLEQTRGESPTKHAFECQNCGAHGYVFEGGTLTFSGSFEHAGRRYGDAENSRFTRGV